MRSDMMAQEFTPEIFGLKAEMAGDACDLHRLR